MARSSKLFFEVLEVIREGCLVVREPGGQERTFGDPDGGMPIVRLQVRNEALYSRLLSFGALGLGESYMEGWWDEENGRLVDLMAIILNNNLKRRIGESRRLRLRMLSHWLRTLPTRINSVTNVRHHYDLGNSFFELFLDSSMTYSCGYQCHQDDSLYQMQIQKFELICRKLDLQPGDRLVDVGCGWGSMLIYAAKHYGVSGVGVTLSKRQQAWAQKRIAEEGLDDRLEVRLQDYRDVDGRFDKFVSIGMFEHVGKEYYGVFMRKLHGLLKSGGIGILHTIGTTGRRYPGPWLRNYIFPGTCLPFLDDLSREMRATDLVVAHVENWKPHYAETARHWKERYNSRRQEVGTLGPTYDERFQRMWDYFLQLLEGCFRYDTLQLYQVLFCKGQRWSLPSRLDFGDVSSGLARSESMFAT